MTEEGGVKLRLFVVDELSGGLATCQLSCTVVETGDCISEMSYGGSDARAIVDLFEEFVEFSPLNM